MYDFPIKLVLGTTVHRLQPGAGADTLLFCSLNERNKTSSLDKMQPVHDNTEPVQPVHYVLERERCVLTALLRRCPSKVENALFRVRKSCS